MVTNTESVVTNDQHKLFSVEYRENATRNTLNTKLPIVITTREALSFPNKNHNQIKIKGNKIRLQSIVIELY